MVAWRTCKFTVGHVEMYRRAIPHLVHDVICLLDMGNGRKSWTLFCEHYVVSLSVCYPVPLQGRECCSRSYSRYATYLFLRPLLTIYLLGPVH